MDPGHKDGQDEKVSSIRVCVWSVHICKARVECLCVYVFESMCVPAEDLTESRLALLCRGITRLFLLVPSVSSASWSSWCLPLLWLQWSELVFPLPPFPVL